VQEPACPATSVEADHIFGLRFAQAAWRLNRRRHCALIGDVGHVASTDTLILPIHFPAPT
jgi:hypothetical protein